MHRLGDMGIDMEMDFNLNRVKGLNMDAGMDSVFDMDGEIGMDTDIDIDLYREAFKSSWGRPWPKP